MSPGLLLRSRPLTGCLCALTAAVLAGCTTTPPAPTVSGTTLTVYLSAPANLATNSGAQDVIDAELLGFHPGCTLSSCAPIHIHNFTVRLVPVRSNKISDNARTAIDDKTSVAYLGEPTGSSVDSLGITNAQDLLQVSPAEHASVPTKDFESFSTYGRTFASMPPNSGAQAQALATNSGGKAFGREFRSQYGHTPSAQAIFGYAAAAAVLTALQNAGSSANDRGAVRAEFFAPPKNAQLLVGPAGPALGTYTVSKGIVTITPASG